jgi:hypothetical protein
MIEFFYVESRVDNFWKYNDCYDDVPLRWFVFKRDKPMFIPYDQIKMQGWDGLDRFGRDFCEQILWEYFTKEESEQFRNYLERYHIMDCTIKQAALSVDEEYFMMRWNEMGTGSYNSVYYPIYLVRSYNLPFLVKGEYYYWKGKPVDKSSHK